VFSKLAIILHIRRKYIYLERDRKRQRIPCRQKLAKETYILMSSAAEPHQVHAALAPGKSYDAAPTHDPSNMPKFLKRTKFYIMIEGLFLLFYKI
jgi:hypothetical protein